MSTGQTILLVSVGLALAFGLYRLVTDGRFVGTRRLPTQAVAEPDDPQTNWLVDSGLASALGDRATLLQFSSAFCAPCRATRRVLAEVAQSVPGVKHVEVDAEEHLDLVRQLGVVRTPTTLVLNANGEEFLRAAGLPRKEQVLQALASAT